MPRGDSLRRIPEERQCTATVKDPRSKNVGLRCPNPVMHGKRLCSGHLGVPQRYSRLNRERDAILGNPSEQVEAARDVEDAARDFHEQQGRQLREHHAAQLRKEQLVAEHEAEETRLALQPPERTPQQKADGFIYVRRYFPYDAPPRWATVLRDESKRPFTWTLRHLDEHIRIEQTMSVADHMEPRDDIIERHLKELRKRYARAMRSIVDPLDPRLRKGYRGEHTELAEQIAKYEPIPIDLNNLPGVRRR